MLHSTPGIPPPPPPAVAVVSDLDQAAVIFQPLRLAILAELRAPDSAAGVARRLGLPRQRLNHHLRELERAGLVRFVEERRKGNCIERLYRASAEGYLISPEALGPVSPAVPPSPERFSWAHLVARLGKALRDLATLRRRADETEQHLVTFALDTRIRFASPRALAQFRDRLASEVARLAAEFHADATEEGRAYDLFLGCHPALEPSPDADDGPGTPSADKRSTTS